jgi:hypothetical protein
MQNEEVIHDSKIRMLTGMMLSPGTVLKKAVSGLPLYFSVAVAGLAFGLFLLQTGLDLYRTGKQTLLFVVITTIIGIVFGAIVVPLISIVIWGIARLFGSSKGVKWTVSAFCMSYSGALIYCILGTIASLTLGWRTSVAFGVTGVLWTIGPMNATIREMVGGKILLCVLLATATGAVVLFCWSLIGRY